MDNNPRLVKFNAPVRDKKVSYERMPKRVFKKDEDKRIADMIAKNAEIKFIRKQIRHELKREKRLLRRKEKHNELLKQSKIKQIPPSPTWVPHNNIDVNSPEFLQSYDWRRLRMMVLKQHGSRCQCCGATPADGLMMHVDHIKPRRTHPHLALVLDNLQVLCEVCNHGKVNWDDTDWRTAQQSDLDVASISHLRAIK